MEIVLLILTGFFLLYLAILSIFALVAPTKNKGHASGIRRFAVVVPAHNEETSLQKTLRSLFAMDYPRTYFDVVVIADNCSDQTAEIARGEGATVYERTNATLRGKGYALRWCFDQLLQRQPRYDAIMIIDADSVASQNFLAVMNSYIENGSKAVQSSDMVAPQPGAWSSEITRLGFTLYNHTRPLGRQVFGGSAGIRGNGMCFTSETLRTLPWNTYSLNEDLEYGLVLLLHGITVDFAPEAQVLATMPTAARNAESQRARWEKGRSPVIRKYSPLLLKDAIRHFSFRSFDAFVELVTPPFVNLFAGVVVLCIANFLLAQLGVHTATLFIGWWVALVGLGIIHVLVGLPAAHADVLLYKAFFYIPRYVFWKLMLYGKVFRRGPSEEWIRTTREQAVESSLTSK